MEFQNRKDFKVGLKAASSMDAQGYLAANPYQRASSFVKELPEGATKGDRDEWFVMTDAGADREGDIILSQGVDTEQWEQYGSVLWGHRADEPRFVMGAPSEVVKGDTNIVVRATFLGEEENEDAARVLRMIRAGAVRAMSIGLRIHEYSEASDRPGFMPLNIIRSEAIETSITPVPMNPRAVHIAAGEDPTEQKAVAELFEVTTDDEAQLAASSAVTGLNDVEIKCLVQRALNEISNRKTYSISQVSPGHSLDETLAYFARLAAQ